MVTDKNASIISQLKIPIFSPLLVLASTLGSLSNDDGDGNEDGKKAMGLAVAKQQLCTCTRLMVHFFAVTARLRRESA